jgi:hypothetical protein
MGAVPETECEYDAIWRLKPIQKTDDVTSAPPAKHGGATTEEVEREYGKCLPRQIVEVLVQTGVFKDDATAVMGLNEAIPDVHRAISRKCGKTIPEAAAGIPNEKWLVYTVRKACSKNGWEWSFVEKTGDPIATMAGGGTFFVMMENSALFAVKDGALLANGDSVERLRHVNGSVCFAVQLKKTAGEKRKVMETDQQEQQKKARENSMADSNLAGDKRKEPDNTSMEKEFYTPTELVGKHITMSTTKEVVYVLRIAGFYRSKHDCRYEVAKLDGKTVEATLTHESITGSGSYFRMATEEEKDAFEMKRVPIASNKRMRSLKA